MRWNPDIQLDWRWIGHRHMDKYLKKIALFTSNQYNPACMRPEIPPRQPSLIKLGFMNIVWKGNVYLFKYKSLFDLYSMKRYITSWLLISLKTRLLFKNKWMKCQNVWLCVQGQFAGMLLVLCSFSSFLRIVPNRNMLCSACECHGCQVCWVFKLFSLEIYII